MLIAGTTRCPAGHDMTADGAWVALNRTGTYGRCRKCVNEQQRGRRGRYHECRVCAKPFFPPRQTYYCGRKCQSIAHAESMLAVGDEKRRREADKTEAILMLVEERERCATWWEREEVDRKLQELRA